MKSFPPPILAAFLHLASPAYGAELATLSDCSSEGWNTSRAKQEYSLQLVAGEKECSARFEIRPDETQISNGWRAEIKDPETIYKDATIHYEFETFLPSNLKAAGTTRLVLAQWHDRKISGIPAQRPPLSLRLHNGRLIFVLFNQAIIDQEGEESKGKTLAAITAPWDSWIKIEVRARWFADHMGSLQIFANNKLIGQYNGQIGYPADIYSPYFKLGIYTVHPFQGPAFVQHRNVRRTIHDWGEYDQQ